MSIKNELSSYEKNIYNIYLKTSRESKGYTPRKNFDNLKEDVYVNLKKISKTLYNKKIDPYIFFKAPYELYNEKFINFEYYSTFAAVSTYRKHIEQIELTDPDNQYNINKLRDSMKFIYQTCADNKKNSAYDYLKLQRGIYPNYILDLKKGDISYYSIIALGLQEHNIELEKKVVEFACKNFYNMLSSLRTRYTFSGQIKPLSIKLIKNINKILKIR